MCQVRVALLAIAFIACSLSSKAAEIPVEEAVAVQLDIAKSKIQEDDLGAAADALERAIELGYDSYFSLKYDGSLAPLRKSEHWSSVMNAFESRFAWAHVLEALLEKRGTFAERYRLVLAWWSSGVPTPEQYAAPIRQVGGSLAGFMGDYREAAMIGETTKQNLSFLAAGFNQPKVATREIIELFRESRVVLLNESHHRTETRISNLLLLRALAKLGFTHVALEAFGRDAKSDTCGSDSLSDAELVDRGYAIARTGYYFNDPVYAELLAEALGNGLIPIGYDSTGAGLSGADREEFQAQKIACILKDPTARVVVIGGMGHISEAPDRMYPGGLMGARLARATGLDPVSIATFVLDHSQEYPEVGEFLRSLSTTNEPWIFENARGESHSFPGYDLSVFVPAIESRSSQNSTLELEGTRRPISVDGLRCNAEMGCIVEAVVDGREGSAIPSDRCRMNLGNEPCLLFLKSGTFQIRLINLEANAIGKLVARVMVQ